MTVKQVVKDTDAVILTNSNKSHLRTHFESCCDLVGCSESKDISKATMTNQISHFISHHVYYCLNNKVMPNSTDRDRQADIQSDRHKQTERQAKRQTERQYDEHTDINILKYVDT